MFHERDEMYESKLVENVFSNWFRNEGHRSSVQLQSWIFARIPLGMAHMALPDTLRVNHHEWPLSYNLSHNSVMIHCPLGY